jgi:hypothetical protein
MSGAAGNMKSWGPTGLRVPLLIAQTLAAGQSTTINGTPQMDFQGQNIIIDTIIVGPSCTITVPQVGTTPQIAGGPSGTGVPGTIFSPGQSSPMDFQMMLIQQGNNLSTTVTNTNASQPLNFAMLIFGEEVDQLPQGAVAAAAAAGVLPAGSMVSPRFARAGVVGAGALVHPPYYAARGRGGR